MLLHGIGAFDQRPGQRHTAGVGGHGGDQRFTLINAELHTFQGFMAISVRFSQADITRRRHILHVDVIGFPVLIGFDLRGIMAVGITSGRLGFFHLEASPIQPIGFSVPIGIRGNDSRHFTHARSIQSGWPGQAGDRELHACQRFLGQAVCLGDLDLGCDDGIVHVCGNDLVMLRHGDSVVGVIQQETFRGFYLMHIISAVFHHVAPCSLAVCVGSQDRQLGTVHGADRPFVGAAGFRHQFILRSSQGDFRTFLHLDKADAADDGRIIEGGGIIAVDRHLHLIHVHPITGRSADLAHIIGAIGQVHPFGLTVGVCGDGITIGVFAAVVKLELCACQLLLGAGAQLGHNQTAVLDLLLKIQGRGLHFVRRTILRDQYFLDGNAGNAYQEGCLLRV